MNKKDKIKLTEKYLLLANDLDKYGFHKEAAKIDSEILSAIKSDIIPLNKKISNKNIKIAIRGQSDWEDYLRAMSTGAGGGAGFALGSGIGAGAAPAAALFGAGLTAASTKMSDVAFNRFYGQTKQMEALTNDLVELSNQIANTIKQVNPYAAQQIVQLATMPQKVVAQTREKLRQQLSKQYGLDPSKGFLQSLTHPISALERNIGMYTAKQNKNKMQKTSANNDSIILDPSVAATGLAKGQGLKSFNPLTGGLPISGWGWAGGAIGASGGKWVGEKAYNLLRGKTGILNKQISDIQKIGQALAKISGDPSILQITQQIASLAQRSFNLT